MPIIASTANSMGWVQVPCTINAKPVNLNFDSGAQLSAIGFNIAKQLAIARTSIVGSINVQSASQGVTTMPLAEVSMSIAGGPGFRTRVILDNATGFNGIIGRNDLNTTHSICFQPNGVTQLFPLFTNTQRYVKLASSSPLTHLPGTVNGFPVSMLFDTGSVGSPASSAISQQVANNAKVMDYVGTATVQGISGGSSGAQIGIINMSVDGSPPFQTYVDVDPNLTEQCLLSRQDITRVYSACLGPNGLTKSPVKVPQLKLPSSGMPATKTLPGPPETSPNPMKLRTTTMQNIDPVVILGAGGFIVVVLAVMLFRRR